MFVAKTDKSSPIILQQHVVKHGSHDQSTHNPKKGGGGGRVGGGTATTQREPQDQNQRAWDTKGTLRGASSRDVIGTSYQGEVRTTRSELTQALGNPQIGGMDKSTIHWGVVDKKTGVVATVYDWKRSPERGSSSEYATNPPAMGDILDFNIGGTAGAVALVNNALFRAKQHREKNK